MSRQYIVVLVDNYHMCVTVIKGRNYCINKTDKIMYSLSTNMLTKYTIYVQREIALNYK